MEELKNRRKVKIWGTRISWEVVTVIQVRHYGALDLEILSKHRQ